MSEELSPAGSKRLVAIKCDVSKEEDILSMMSAIKSQFGGADICINNAGLGHYATLLSGSSTMWREMLEVPNDMSATQTHSFSFLHNSTCVSSLSCSWFVPLLFGATQCSYTKCYWWKSNLQ